MSNKRRVHKAIVGQWALHTKAVVVQRAPRAQVVVEQRAPRVDVPRASILSTSDFGRSGKYDES